MDPLEQGIPWLRRWGLFAGPLLALLAWWLLRGVDPAALPGAGRMTIAVGVLMSVWWLTEALPIEITALVPLAVFPLAGVASMKAAAAPYADQVIFLFMGGLMLGLSMERWGLHRRVAVLTLSCVGTRPAMLVGGVMLATALISAWVSNTATAVMMLPIGMSVAAIVGDAGGRRFGTCLMLGIAYAASIGGVGTLVGTPPNAVLAGVAREKGLEPITFARWLLIGLPIVAVFLPLAWVLLTRVLEPVPWRPAPGVDEAIARQRRELGPLSAGESWTLAVFVAAALSWVFRVPLGRATGLIREGSGGATVELLTDAGIAIIAALALFALPAGRGERVMDWPTAARLPWGVLVLFGGGLSLADAMTANGVDTYIGGVLTGLGGVHPLLVILVVSASVVALTEVASNTAVATAFLPIAFAAAGPLGVHPYLLMIPTAIAASYAFMMPMGTPPNALVFASGRVTVRQMARAGLVLNISAVIVITAMSYFLFPSLLGFAR